MKLTNAQISQVMTLLGLTQNDFRAIEHAPSFEVGQQRLAELKARVKKQFRKVALVLHPDRTDNDPVRTEAFKLVASVVDDIEKLAFGRPPAQQPRPATIRIVFVRGGGFGYSSGTASTTTNTYYGGGWGF